jgi:DNA-binding NarL/FixJ family response regulator
MIKLYVIEDHEMIIVSGLRNAFRPSRDQIEGSGSAPNLLPALIDPRLAAVDLIILDLWIPGDDAVESMRQLKVRSPGMPVMIFTSEDLPLWQQKMVDAGAHGFVKKNCSREILKLAIETIAGGKTWYTLPLVTETSPDTGERKPFQFPDLTPVETQIAVMLANGSLHGDIARNLHTSRTMIDNTLMAMRKKYHCRTTVELIKFLTDTSII